MCIYNYMGYTASWGLALPSPCSGRHFGSREDRCLLRAAADARDSAAMTGMVPGWFNGRSWGQLMIYDWLVVTGSFFNGLEHDFYFSHWECHHPNWRSHIFQRGRYTTNQTWSMIFQRYPKFQAHQDGKDRCKSIWVARRARSTLWSPWLCKTFSCGRHGGMEVISLVSENPKRDILFVLYLL